MSLAANDQATDEVRAIASFELHELKDWLISQHPEQPLTQSLGTDYPQRAHYFYAAQEIDQFEKNPKQITVPPPPPPPDGSPIGTLDDED
jgi:hypothetical protein